MLTIGGLLLLFGCVLGSYLASGGSMAPLIEAVPFEMWTIGGAAIATMLMGNSMHDVKHTMGAFGKMLKGAAYHKQDYIDLLSLLFFLVRLASTKGTMALEPHIEKPDDSAAFQKFPKILANHHASTIICDYLRMVGMNADDPNQIEDVMARELKKTLMEELHPPHIMQTMADGLPALGIVAAVLGVIKTMAHIDQPPADSGGDDRWRADRDFSGRSAGLRICRPVLHQDEGYRRGGGEVSRSDPGRAGHASAWQRTAGQRRIRAEDGADRAHADVSGTGRGDAGDRSVVRPWRMAPRFIRSQWPKVVRLSMFRHGGGPSVGSGYRGDRLLLDQTCVDRTAYHMGLS